MLHCVTKRYASSRILPGSVTRLDLIAEGAVMTFNDSSESIREINLSYIMLVQRLLQKDRSAGMLRLGLSKEVADILAALTLAQVVKFAASNHLLCSFRFNDHAMLSALTDSTHRADIAEERTAVSMVRQQAVQFA
jgi:flagellar transcriptional activator FlhD